jgi:hypothetical protein
MPLPLAWLQLAAQGGEAAPVLPFIQMAELAGFSVTIDYRPRRLDLAALRVSEGGRQA